MKLLLIAVIATTLCFSPRSAIAQNSNPVPVSAIASDQPEDAVRPSTGKPVSVAVEDPIQVQLLKQQNALLAQHNSELLQVVLWAIGFSAAFLLGFLALFGYLTFRRYEQEKDALTVLLKSELAADVAKLETKFSEKAANLEKTHREHVAKLLESVHKESNTAVQAVLQPIDLRVTEHDRRLAAMQLSILEQEAELWMVRKIPTNAFRAWCRYGELATTSKVEWQIGRAVDQMLGAIEGGAKVPASDAAAAVEFLSKVPEKFQTMAAKVRQAL